MATSYADEAALQTALNAAAPGATIDITGSGTIDITTTLTIPAGVSLTSTDNSTLQADPAFSNSTPIVGPFNLKDYYPIVYVSGAGNTTISGITVAGQSGGNATFVDGIYANNTGTITITNVTVKDINLIPATSGVQQDSGIIIADPANAVITGSTVTNIHKNYIDFASAGTLTANNNTITETTTGSNAASNGIVVRSGTANLNNNTVSAMTDTTSQSTCIDTLGGTTVVNGGTLDGCDYGVQVETGTAPTVYDNVTISGSKVQPTLDMVTGGTLGTTPAETAPVITQVTENPDGSITVTGTGVPGDYVTVTFPNGTTATVLVAAGGTYSASSAPGTRQPRGSVTAVQNNALGSGTSPVVTRGYTPAAAPTATSVPTTSDAGLATLGLLLAGLAAVALRRRQTG